MKGFCQGRQGSGFVVCNEAEFWVGGSFHVKTFGATERGFLAAMAGSMRERPLMKKSPLRQREDRQKRKI